ncbi:MAG: 3-dehydroquinate synthase family protein [Acidobacteriota bacterium]
MSVGADSGGLHRVEVRPGPVRQESTVVVGAGALGSVEGLRSWLEGRTLFVVTSPTVARLHGHRLDPMRRTAGRCVDLEPVPDGEVAKTLDHAGALWRQMLDSGGKRDSRLVAFGGGSVGDLGGFVAGCFLRGIEVVQVPTTLLAQVDAAVGGKTAVDMPTADGVHKNSVGVFHHPAWVLADTALLSTLPAAELRSGLVEVVKMAALLDVELFERVERDLDRLLAGDGDALAPVVAAAARAKAAVVEADAREGGLRKILNFGHTMGHAFEGLLLAQADGGDGVVLRHGEAVAYGLRFALQLAQHLDLASDDLGPRMDALLNRFQLPTLPLGKEHGPRLLELLARDKKATEQGLVWVLPTGFGDRSAFRTVPPEVVGEVLDAFLAGSSTG